MKKMTYEQAKKEIANDAVILEIYERVGSVAAAAKQAGIGRKKAQGCIDRAKMARAFAAEMREAYSKWHNLVSKLCE